MRTKSSIEDLFERTAYSGIEDWIREKADYRLASSGARFVWPYDVGRWNNLKQVLTIMFQCTHIASLAYNGKVAIVLAWWLTLEAYLIFVIYFPQARFVNPKLHPKMTNKRVKYTVFRVKSGKYCT